MYSRGNRTGNSYAIRLLGIVNNWHRLGESGKKQWQLELKTFLWNKKWRIKTSCIRRTPLVGYVSLVHISFERKAIFSRPFLPSYIIIYERLWNETSFYKSYYISRTALFGFLRNFRSRHMGSINNVLCKSYSKSPFINYGTIFSYLSTVIKLL